MKTIILALATITLFALAIKCMFLAADAIDGAGILLALIGAAVCMSAAAAAGVFALVNKRPTRPRERVGAPIFAVISLLALALSACAAH